MPGVKDEGWEGTRVWLQRSNTGSLEVMKLFVLIVVVVTQMYTCAKIVWNYADIYGHK